MSSILNSVAEYLLYYAELAIATIDYNYNAFRCSADTTRKGSAQKQFNIFIMKATFQVFL